MVLPSDRHHGGLATRLVILNSPTGRFAVFAGAHVIALEEFVVVSQSQFIRGFVDADGKMSLINAQSVAHANYIVR